MSSSLSSYSKLFVLRNIFQRILPITQKLNIRLFSSSQFFYQKINSNDEIKLSMEDINDKSNIKKINREQLLKLHNLSALNPPLKNSKEEKELMDELSDLINFMNQLKDVKLPSSFDERSELLTYGMSEVIISKESLNQLDQLKSNSTSQDVIKEEGKEKSGKELLNWSTNRLGDYYASRIKKS
ncbi:uncharacterized protein I206_104998 [Kwoniella pini CBS 10737]|uniref:Glutamyl-tRNA amidotransferase complex subunit Gta3 domain-containing protein n=1 Tax=Kwoniella pini CBS 10737 TaxID=1296096 RepID=A0A1B9I8U4_9TREE|nr:uncharacterized protein I206_02537 [Kwoniella pini CBS 10737]OCF51821.1 hypothetical protein I206_02537 [Kwoniella pini CBS 10737]